MKVFKSASAVAVVLALGTLLPAYPQHDGKGNQRDERQDRPSGKADQPDKGNRQQGQVEAHGQPRPQRKQPERARPQATFPQARTQRQEVEMRASQARQPQPQQPQRTQQQARSWQQQKGWAQHGGWQGHDTFQQDRAQHWASDHRSWAQRGGYGGYYIPQDRFSLNFGSQHTFRLQSRPVMYMGYPRFDHNGFSFLIVDPWPEYWADNWYDSDDVYVEYDDGYYLRNRRSPEVRLAITLNL